MEDRRQYHTYSSKNKLDATCSRSFTKCPTCSTSFAKGETSFLSNICETYSSDDNSEDDSENFLPKWDRYLSTLSIDASSSRKQAIFGLRHAIEERNIYQRRSSTSSGREHRQQVDPVSPRMNRILEFMSMNDMPFPGSCPSSASSEESKLLRLLEYLDIKAGIICCESSVKPPGVTLEEEVAVAPEVGTNHEPAIQPSYRCPICLDDLVPEQQAKELQCEHRFHLNCIALHFRWQREKWCPVCTYYVRLRKERSSSSALKSDWRRFWVCFRGAFSRINARNSFSSSSPFVSTKILIY